MSRNKAVVEQYMQGFRELDHPKILSCLTENVEWYMPGYFHRQGKAAFDREIENDAFTGSPEISIDRMTEEQNVVIAEGRVQARFKDGNLLDALFCDVFEMQDGKIAKLITYQVNRSAAARTPDV